MGSVKRASLITAALASAVVLFSSMTPAVAQPGAGAVNAMREGKAAFEKRCKLCHSLRLALARVKTREGWTLSVKRMVTFGAPLNAEQRNNVISYLTARSTFEQNCGTCHEPTRVVPDDDAARDWKATLERMAGHVGEMQAKGEAEASKPLTKEQTDDVAAYLTVILGE